MPTIIEESPHYLEILKLMIAEKSGRWISQYLQDKYDEYISYSTINYFKRNNTNIASLIQQLESQQIISDGVIDDFNKSGEIIEVVDNQIVKANETDKLLINKINRGVNVINLVRDGIEIFEDADIFHDFFESNDVSLKDKMDMGLKLIKLDLDWQKSSDTNININNNMMDLKAFFSDDLNWD